MNKNKSSINTTNYNILLFLYSLLLIFFIFFPSEAEEKTLLSFLKNNIQLSGAATTQGEAYHANGIESRRPDAVGRLMLTPNLAVLNLVNISTDILLSTDGSHTRQDINVLGFHPTWKWGKAHLGDFSDNFSQYTFSGASVRGAEIDLFPAWLRFSAAGGQTRRAVSGDATNEAYAQYLGAGRAGYLFSNGSYVDVMFLKVKDDIGSLHKAPYGDSIFINPDTLAIDLDTIWIKPPVNPYAVTPQENIVAGLAGQVNLLGKRLVLQMEVCGSAFSKDLNAEEVSADSLTRYAFAQDILSAVFTPRRSSLADIAVSSNIKFGIPLFNIEVGYNYVGPGYTSLGMPSLANDRREILASTSFSLGKSRVSLGWNRFMDNCLGQKLATNTRDQVRGSVAARVNKWQSQYSLTGVIMSSDAAADSLAWKYNNILASTYQGIVFDRESIVRQLGIQYTFQASLKDMYASKMRAQYHTATLNGSARIVKSLGLNASAGVTARDPETSSEWQITQVYSLRASHSAVKNRLNNSLFASSSMIRDTRVARFGLNSGFNLTPRNQINLDASHSLFRGTKDFEETRGSLTVTHRF